MLSRLLIALLMLAVPTLVSTPAWAALQPALTVGNYAYDQPPNAGDAPDKGQSGLLAFGQGKLADASITTRAEWFGDGAAKYKVVSIVIDLLRDYPVDQISIVSNAPNRYYGIRAVSVRARAEAEPDYTSIRAQTWYGTASPLPDDVPLNNTLTVNMGNRTTRLIIIRIARLHEYQHMALNEISVHPGTGEPAQDPAPPLSADRLRAEIAKPVKQIPRSGMVDVGNYLAGVTPDDGVPDSSGGVVPFLYSTLFNRDRTDYVGWRGSASAPKTVSLVFDLLADHPLDTIRLFSRAPNQYWSFDEITVTYRAEADTTYKIARIERRDRADTDYTLEISMAGKKARFVRLQLTRTNQYLHIPLSEIEFVQGSGEVGQDPAPPYDEQAMREELTAYTRLADQYGQYLYQDWPGKLTSDAQLNSEREQEWEHLRSVVLDPGKYDTYGGLKALGKQPSDGYFRLRKIDGKWWFVTPDGYPFLLKGVDSVSHDEWGYGTLYKEPDGSLRDVFESVPDHDRYAAAYSTTDDGEVLSFVKANLMRKYQGDWKAVWRQVTGKRLIDWGFNGLSKWARDSGVRLPYIDQLPAPADAVRVKWAIDPFDPGFGAKLDRKIEEIGVAGRSTDPWLIGYFFDNERGWDAEVVKEILLNKGTLPAKGAFVDYMADAYGQDLARVNSILGTNASTFDALAGIPIDVGRLPAQDMTGFIRLASKTYYTAIRTAIRTKDPNHLFLGSALVPTWRTSFDWNVGGIDQLDAVSFDVYSDSADYLNEYANLDKPVLNLEYSFSTADRGLRAINAATLSETIAQRGAKYRSFIEAQAGSPVFVGSGWFVYYDQAVTGRPGDGESFNFGLLNQQDQPYTEMTDIMRDTNTSLELVHKYGTSLLTAEMVADSISRLGRVDAHDPVVPLPHVPEAFSLEIASTTRADVVTLDGTVRPSSAKTLVTLVLKVARKSDGSTASTRPLSLWVPKAFKNKDKK
ncbi:hypothetical protein [Nonomuraea sp. NPDC049784]|uniref:hypothetical protein n=1 Tax=Nonomuraea sp. NPDC049784 TaxID=3154361 RepID=UPI0033CAF4F6